MSSRSGGRGLSTGKRVPGIIGDYLAADNPTNLATGDLNGDRIADLVVPNFHSNNISVLLGKADGSFQQVRLFDDGVGRPFDAVIADFNGDGKNDVAVTIPVTAIPPPGFPHRADELLTAFL